MRDAFGGSFMIMIFLVFIMIYISFTAVALNYAKAFKVKNAVIEYMEKSEIESLDEMTVRMHNDFKEFIDNEIVGNYNYTVKSNNICNGYPEKNASGRIIAICDDTGIIIRESNKSQQTKGVYYTVTTYLGWDIGFFKNLAALSSDKTENGTDEIVGYWKISGQTRLITNKN